jgi:hypothetical protein
MQVRNTIGDAESACEQCDNSQCNVRNTNQPLFSKHAVSDAAAVPSSGWHWSLLRYVTSGTPQSSCDLSMKHQLRSFDAAAGLPGAQQRLALEPAAPCDI